MSESAKNFSTSSADNEPQPVEEQPNDTVESIAPGNPAEFQDMAHDVNPVSGATQTSTDDLVQKALQQPEPDSGASIPDTSIPSQSSTLTTSSTSTATDPKNFFSILLRPFRNYPQQLLQVIAEYKLPVAAFAIVLLATPVIIAAVALLSVLHTIPLMAPILKLVGLGYTTWFVYRHLLRASDRQALLQQVQAFKAQLIGNVLPETEQD